MDYSNPYCRVLSDGRQDASQSPSSSVNSVSDGPASAKKCDNRPAYFDMNWTGYVLTAAPHTLLDANTASPFFLGPESAPSASSSSSTAVCDINLGPRLHLETGLYPLAGTTGNWPILDWSDDTQGYSSLTAPLAVDVESFPESNSSPIDYTSATGDWQTLSPGEPETPPAMDAVPFMDGGCSSDGSGSGSGNRKPQAVKRKAHYRIEKRYRTNINNKIRTLDEMLPKGSSADQQWPEGDERGGDEANFNGGDESMKRSKGEVLSRTIDYLMFLQGKVICQEKKIRELKERMRASRKALGV